MKERSASDDEHQQRPEHDQQAKAKQHQHGSRGGAAQPLAASAVPVTTDSGSEGSGSISSSSSTGNGSGGDNEASGGRQAKEARDNKRNDRVVHVCADRETLAGIALKHGVSLAALKAANALRTDGGLYPGRRLLIPTPPVSPSASDTRSPPVAPMGIANTMAAAAAVAAVVQPLTTRRRSSIDEPRDVGDAAAAAGARAAELLAGGRHPGPDHDAPRALAVVDGGSEPLLSPSLPWYRRLLDALAPLGDDEQQHHRPDLQQPASSSFTAGNGSAASSSFAGAAAAAATDPDEIWRCAADVDGMPGTLHVARRCLRWAALGASFVAAEIRHGEVASVKLSEDGRDVELELGPPPPPAAAAGPASTTVPFRLRPPLESVDTAHLYLLQWLHQRPPSPTLLPLLDAPAAGSGGSPGGGSGFTATAVHSSAATTTTYEDSADAASDPSASASDDAAPQLVGESALLTPAVALAIRRQLPARFRGSPWTLVFQGMVDGFNLHTFYDRLWRLAGGGFRRKASNELATVLVVKSDDGSILGGFSAERWRPMSSLKPQYYGTGECFLFRVQPTTVEVYKWVQGKPKYFMLSDEKQLSWGPALRLDEEFLHGSSRHTETYQNEPLAATEEFRCVAIECWTLDEYA